MSTPKERSILFSQPMVLAILDDRKTHTRRIVRNQPVIDENGYIRDSYWLNKPFDGLLLPKIDDLVMYCPYGKPGDRLWVRETFQPLFAEGIEYHSETNFKTGDGYKISYPATDGILEFVDPDDNISTACMPSIHMPRWASRISLEITGIRVERLQDISEDDAKSEGSYVCDYHGRIMLDQRSNQGCYKWGYRSLWESINGKGSWDLNPFVWVVEFKRIKSDREAV
ncbi:MAG: hypothetical protein HRU77_01690 [Gammaproteobacteria bacterium]|nr:MAG: hypothetical protein HRU77_01690 [Gammaproteobacteria bacterium]